MVYECPVCKHTPESHSLKRVRETEDCVYFYTCPAQATRYNDTEGILTHYRGVLTEIPVGKEWVWVFDAQGFTMAHAMEFTLATKMATMITQEFGDTLRQIYIIHPTSFIHITINVIWPFLSQRLRNIIRLV